jgi:hypothetical protein
VLAGMWTDPSVFGLSCIVAPASAMRVIAGQLKITWIIFPIALIFPDGSHHPVAFACRFGNAWLDARRRTRTLMPINTHRPFGAGPSGRGGACPSSRSPSSSSNFLRFPLRDPVSSDPAIVNEAPLGIGQESSGVTGEWKYICMREGGGGITDGAGISDVGSSGSSVSFRNS